MPSWQKGLLNGVGGKVEATDLDAYAAMQREFKEETGKDTEPTSWLRVLTLYFNYAIVDCFAIDFPITDNFDDFICTEAETLVEIPVCEIEITQKLMYNLRLLIPMAIDRLREES